jgi:hypothetical protein
MNAASEDVKDMLVEALGMTLATDLFIGKLPPQPDNCTAIFDIPGSAPMLTLDGSGQYYYPSVQVRVRNRSYLDGLELCYSIVRALHGRHGETWNDSLYTAVVCQGDPGMLGWDEENRVEFFVNFNLQRR